MTGAERSRDLDREGADAAGGAVDEHPLPGLQPAPVSQALQGGQRGDTERGGGVVLQVVRGADQGGGRQQGVLREGSAVGLSEDAVADGERGDTGPDGGNGAGDVGAGEGPLRASQPEATRANIGRPVV